MSRTYFIMFVYPEHNYAKKKMKFHLQILYFETFCNMIVFYSKEVLALFSPPQLEGQFFSSCPRLLFNIFAAALEVNLRNIYMYIFRILHQNSIKVKFSLCLTKYHAMKTY
jgi:hypothetical protein